MADVDINKFRASVVRDGSKPASPGFIVSEGQDPVDPAGNGQNHLPVTIATAATGLSITDSQVLGGAGTVGQYIRGDGSLADFPQASGGGSSVSYYLNGSVSQGTIGGVAYKELNKVPILGAGTDFTINADGYIASFLTDAGDPNLLEIAGGNWNFETYFSASSSGGTPSFYVELYKYDGTTFTLIASSSSSPELIAFGTNLNPYFSTLAVPTTTLALTDRLAVRYYVTHSGRTITLHTENNHLCQVVTTFTTGLTSLNGLTAQVQNLAVGTSGTDFNIASATATHTFNLPTASATNRGALSSADWTTFNNKQNALGYVPVPETRTITINGVSQDLSANRTYNVGTVTSVGLSSATSGVTIGGSPVTGVGAFTLAIATANGSQNGLLSSTDWTIFNNKQNALTNPVTGTGTTNYLPKFTGSTTIGNSQIFDNGTGVGIGTTSPQTVSSGFTLTVGDGATQQQPYLALSRNSLGGFWAGIRWYDGNTIKSVIQEDSDFNLRFSTSNAEAMRIFAGQNVHIGPTPASDNGAKLQVSGYGSFTVTGDNTRAIRVIGPTNRTGYLGHAFGTLFIQNNNYFNGSSYIFDDISIGCANVTLGQDIAFQTGAANTNPTTKVFITNSGNVGIGTDSPMYVLDAYSTGSSTARLRVQGTTNFALTQAQNSSGILYMGIDSSTANGFGLGNYSRIIWSSADYPLIFAVNDAERMRITSGGEVLIGNTDNGAYNLQCNGTGVWGAGAYVNGSDRNIKDNIATIEKGLEYIQKMNPVKFRYKPNYTRDHSMQTGFIAQELQEVFASEDYVNGLVQQGVHLSVAYQNLLPILVKAIQELKQEIDTLKN